MTIMASSSSTFLSLLIWCLLLHIVDSTSSVNSVSKPSFSLSMEREILGSGFHRTIKTTLSLLETFERLKDECRLMIMETLPSGLYADPFQLKQMESFDGPQVVFDREVDIEAPEYSSKTHQLYIFADLFNSETESETNSVPIHLPVHARYQRLSEDRSVTHTEVQVPFPKVYTNCSSYKEMEESRTVDAPCDVSNSSLCSWNYVPYTTTSSILRLNIPNGQEADMPLVVLVTLLVSVSVCAMLIKKLYDGNDTHTHNKQS